MNQTPVHDHHNPDLLRLIPRDAKNLVEIGCSSGALAREFKKRSPSCHYVGVEIDSGYAVLAERFCDEFIVLDIESANEEFWLKQRDVECWIFGDTLEHMRDPWKVLKGIRNVLPARGCVVACIPNAQHWSVQARLSVGQFRYEESGLLDRTHLRWFTRQTMVELFEEAGFGGECVFPRIFNEPNRDIFIPAIQNLARLAGADGDGALADALPLQYVLRAKPR